MKDLINKLTDEQYRITQEHGTEPAFSGAYWDKKDPGNYFCVCCNTKLFSSNTKYDMVWLASFTSEQPFDNL